MDTTTRRPTEDMPAPVSGAVDTSLDTATSTSTNDRSTSSDNSLADGMRSLMDGSESEAKEQVVIYLSQNSTSHHKDEIPEALASLKHGNSKGYGDRKMIPVSDPYKDGTTTYEGAFGDASKDMTWWQDDKDLSNGQLKIGDQVLSLGAQSNRYTDDDVAQVREDWRTLLLHVGLSSERAEDVLTQLLTDSAGNAKLTESGAGAANELAQLIALFSRAESGEFEIHSVILSGHHYSDTNHLFGEHDSGGYDDDVLTGDTLNLKDLEALKGVFPKAFAQVKSVLLNACNTHDLAMSDGTKDQSTNDWLQGTFPNIESSSYWEDTAPGPDMGAFYAGEFMLDTLRKDNGDSDAFQDARYKKTSDGTAIRSETDKDGALSEIPVKRELSSYFYNDYKGLRGTNNEAFHKRDDLTERLYKKKKKED
jgi:hypothetical protein